MNNTRICKECANSEDPQIDKEVMKMILHKKKIKEYIDTKYLCHCDNPIKQYCM